MIGNGGELNKIREFLKTDPRGYNIREIADAVKNNRNSVAKYLDVLTSREEVDVRIFGKSKVYFLSQRVPISDLMKFSSKYIVVINNNRRIVQANQAFLRFTGMTKEQLIPCGMAEIACDFLKTTEIHSLIDRALSGSELDHEIHTVSAAGDRYYKLTLTPTLFRDHSRGVIIVIEDITEKKKTEIALKQSEERARSMYAMMRLMCDTVPDMIWAKDLNKRYLFANRRLLADLLNAQDADEPIGKTDLFFASRERDSHPDDPGWHSFGENCMDSDDIVMETITAQKFEESGNVKSKFLFLDVNKAPLFDEHGKLIGTVGCGRDVTRQKEMEQILRVSEEKYRSLAENTCEVIFSLDPTGVITYISPQCARYGFMREDVVGNRFDHFICRDHIGQINEVFSRHAHTNEKITSVFMVTPKNGNPIWVESTTISRFDPSGTLTAVYGVLRDITERHEAEERLQESEKKYRAIFDNFIDLYYRTDMNGIITDLSSSCLSLTGWDPEELIGKDVQELYGVPIQRRALLEHLYKDGSVRNFEITLLNSTGVKVPVSVNSRIVRDLQGSPIAVEGTIRDITALKQVMIDQAQSQAMLHAVINGSPIPQFVIGRDHSVLFWNRALEKFTGVKAGEVIGTKDAWKVFYSARQPLLADFIVDEKSGMIADLYSGKYPYSVNSDGAYEVTDFLPHLGEHGRMIRFIAAPIHDHNGTIVCVVETIEEITDVVGSGHDPVMPDKEYGSSRSKIS